MHVQTREQRPEEVYRSAVQSSASISRVMTFLEGAPIWIVKARRQPCALQVCCRKPMELKSPDYSVGCRSSTQWGVGIVHSRTHSCGMFVWQLIEKAGASECNCRNKITISLASWLLTDR